MGYLVEHCICIVLEHIWIPDSMLGHFLDHGFVAWGAKN
jgi:hypothetical protein